MQLTSHQFKVRSREKLADVNLQGALKKLQGNFVKGRADRVAELENFPAIRDAAGAMVHWAKITMDMNRAVDFSMSG